MEYWLKHYNTALLKFSASTDSNEPEIDILWKNETKKHLLPLDLESTPEGLSKWLRRRIIPKNRAFVHTFLAKCSLSSNRPMNIIQASKGLSLNDSYWVTENGVETDFEAVNLYDNPFSKALANIAFTGYGSSLRTFLMYSPEFTTNGMLRKCWRRITGKVYLYKGGTEGASNTGFEPYSEYYVSQLAQAMGINAVPYNLSKWKGILCSTCELFTSKDTAYLPVGHLPKKGGIDGVIKYYEELGPEFLNALRDMLVFDAVICNVDRHYGNFGFLVDSRQNKITAPAPLFDHGNSLFNLAGEDSWHSDAALQAFVDTLQPATYDDFIRTAQKVMTPSQKEKLRKLIGFKFKKHSRYNLPAKRLRMIERQIQKRVQELLA